MTILFSEAVLVAAFGVFGLALCLVIALS